ncbi:MAG: radical SAM protein [Spirochaetales bacterium]|nr:radical SAM protein [Spirochaetales bacterium]
MSGFRVIEFQLLKECNARCIYCAYAGDVPGMNFFPLDLIKKTLSEELPGWVWFEGGEVTMSEESKTHLLKAIEIASALGVKSRINTNAQKLTPEWSKRLVKAGLEFACVSFDTLDPGKFCLLRGFDPSSGQVKLNELIYNSKGLINTGITVDLETTLTRYNIDELISLYEFAESCAAGETQVMMGVQCLVAIYDELFELYPGFDSMYNAISQLIEHAKKGRIPVRICCSPLVPCHYPDLYKHHKNVIWVGCSCGVDYVHIHGNGDALLCGFWDHAEPIGNLYEKSLADIWESSMLKKDGNTIAPENCTQCPYWEGTPRCHNLCFSVSHRITGKFTTHSYSLVRRKVRVS